MLSVKALKRLESELRKSYPEMIGFGLGLRREDGRVRKELAIKLVVPKKRSQRSKGAKQFPKHFELPLGKGRRASLIRIHSDVEEPRVWTPLQFQVSDPTGTAIAACWARWRGTNNALKLGIITSGHGLWEIGHALNIASKAGTRPGRVVVSSDLAADSLDATLVEFIDAGVSEADLLSASPQPSVATPLTLDETLQAIGSSATDGKDVRMDQWAPQSTDSATALALHLSYTVNRTDGTSVILHNVVEAKGTVGMFVPGCSGATWATASSGETPRPLAFTSHGSSQLGLGTHLSDAREWLRKSGGLRELQVAWVPGQWW